MTSDYAVLILLLRCVIAPCSVEKTSQGTSAAISRWEGTVDRELASEQVQVERKLFTFELRENPRGRFLRVTEDVGGRRDTIIIPATGLDRIREALDLVIKASEEAGPCPGDEEE